jgi:hypothetical protein
MGLATLRESGNIAGVKRALARVVEGGQVTFVLFFETNTPCEERSNIPNCKLKPITPPFRGFLIHTGNLSHVRCLFVFGFWDQDHVVRECCKYYFVACCFFREAPICKRYALSLSFPRKVNFFLAIW